MFVFDGDLLSPLKLGSAKFDSFFFRVITSIGMSDSAEGKLLVEFQIAFASVISRFQFCAFLFFLFQ